MPLVIQLAGTSGSGKSTVVRRVMEQLPPKEPFIVAPRNAPLGYQIVLPSRQLLFIAGAYEAPTGGCDTIKDIERVMSLVGDMHQVNNHVLFEGLFCMNHTRGPQLARRVGVDNLKLVRLTTSVEECKARVNARRAVEGKEPLVDWSNTEGNNTRAGNYAAKMSFIGVKVHRVSSDDAVGLVLKLLGVW